MDTLTELTVKLWGQAYANWVAGGWCMPPMAVNALIMFSLGLHILFRQQSKKFMNVSEKKWRNWIQNPEERKGTVGEMIAYISSGRNAEDTDRLVGEVRASEIAPFERELFVMGVSASAAPLIGLLGTVTGILTLFAALAHGSGGEETMKLIAEGVSEALIATQTGLVIALPGLIFHHVLVRRHERFKAMIEKMHSVCVQMHYVKTKEKRVSAGSRSVAHAH